MWLRTCIPRWPRRAWHICYFFGSTSWIGEIWLFIGLPTFLIFFPCSFNLLAKTAEKGFWKFRLIQVTCQCIKAKGLLVYIFRCIWPRLKPWFSKQDEMKTSRIDIAKELRDVSGAQILIPTQTYRSSNYEDAAQWAVVQPTLWVTLRKHETRWPTSDSQLVWPSLSWGLVFK